MAATTRKRSAKKTKETVEITDEDRKPGVIYIGHIPHGFYEKELKQYFTQFGQVLSVKVSRSTKNNKARGYAFVKFKYAAVAKTVAETCHNYLFFNKLLKCQYRPLSDMHPRTFVTYNWKPDLKRKRQHNNAKSESKLNSSLKVTTKRQAAKLGKLKDLGLDLKLTDIVDVPTPRPVDTPQKEVKSTLKKRVKKSPQKKTKSPSKKEARSTPQKVIKSSPQKKLKSRLAVKKRKTLTAKK